MHSWIQKNQVLKWNISELAQMFLKPGKKKLE